MTVTIYHNPRCSKSRQTLDILRSRGIEPVIIEYLKSPPDAGELARILAMLDMAAMDLIRPGEEDVRMARAQLTGMQEEERIGWLADHPAAMQRPIVVADGKARLGRPPEAVLDILP